MLKHYKTIGMIGGIPPSATVDYYQRIISRFQERTGQREFPSIIINSINMTYMLNLIANDQLDELIDYLSEEIFMLEKAGAKVIFMASNTPHIVFEQLAKRVKTKMISIIDSTVAYAQSNGHNRLGLFGTEAVMENEYYQDGFEAVGMEIITPMPDERKFINKIYYNLCHYYYRMYNSEKVEMYYNKLSDNRIKNFSDYKMKLMYETSWKLPLNLNDE